MSLVSLPARKLMLQRFLRPLIFNFGSQTFDFYFRLSTFNFFISGFEFLIYDFILRIKFWTFDFGFGVLHPTINVKFSDFRLRIFNLRLQTFESSEFGVYFESLTYNFLTTDFGILIHNFRLLSLQLPRLSL